MRAMKSLNLFPGSEHRRAKCHPVVRRLQMPVATQPISSDKVVVLMGYTSLSASQPRVQRALEVTCIGSFQGFNCWVRCYPWEASHGNVPRTTQQHSTSHAQIEHLEFNINFRPTAFNML